MAKKTPTSIRRLRQADAENVGSGLLIGWSDGTECVIGSSHLRKRCPCADCEAKRGSSSHEKPLSPPPGRSRLQVVTSTLSEELNLVQVWAIGNYAIGIRWGDGHDSGIYNYELLADIAAETISGA